MQCELSFKDRRMEPARDTARGRARGIRHLK
jgi:hypothetical protein